jgi:hypothetical protein
MVCSGHYSHCKRKQPDSYSPKYQYRRPITLPAQSPALLGDICQESKVGVLESDCRVPSYKLLSVLFVMDKPLTEVIISRIMLPVKHLSWTKRRKVVKT